MRSTRPRPQPRDSAMPPTRRVDRLAEPLTVQTSQSPKTGLPLSERQNKLTALGTVRKVLAVTQLPRSMVSPMGSMRQAYHLMTRPGIFQILGIAPKNPARKLPQHLTAL